MIDALRRNRKYNRVSSAGNSGSGGGGGGVSLRLFAASQHVDDRILDEGTEDEDEAGGHPDIDRLGERDGRHSAQVYRALRGDGQHGEDSQGDARRDRLEVDPEGHPRQQDDEQAGQKRRQDVGAQATLEVQVRAKTWKRTCENNSRHTTLSSLGFRYIGRRFTTILEDKIIRKSVKLNILITCCRNTFKPVVQFQS